MIIRNEKGAVNDEMNTPWERFYNYCWDTYVKSPVLAYSGPTLDNALKLELEKFNAVIDVSSGGVYNKHYTIAFINDKDYTVFCLTW